MKCLMFDCDDGDSLSYMLEYERLAKKHGEEFLFDFATTVWNRLSRDERTLFCMCSSGPMSERMINRFFYFPELDTHDRHIIAAGLASSVEEKNAHELLSVLIRKIGRYENKNHQRILERFVNHSRYVCNKKFTSSQDDPR